MPRNRFLLALPAALLLAGAAAMPASAATLTVNSTIDASDANPGNGTCASGGGACTLRAAVEEAAGLPGADTITLPSGSYQLGVGLGSLNIGSTVTINGAGARTTIIRAAANSRVISINATSTLRDLTVTGGNVGSATVVSGSGIRVTAGDVTIERVTVSGNQIASSQVARGGGISMEEPTATLTLLDSTITGNTVTGAYNGSFQGGAGGGGVYTSGPAIIKRSTIAANNVIGGVTSQAAGGGAQISGPATIEQSTFANNGVATVSDSSGSRQGGNLYIADNTAISGTILVAGSGTYGPDCYKFSGTVTEPAKNFTTTTTDCAPTALHGDAKLGSLADNGGQTDTMRPAAGSPVIDAAANCGSRTTDQRGNTLFGGAGCDLGAIEVAASRTVTLQASKTSAAAGEDLTFVAKLENAGFDVAADETLTLELPAGVTATTATPTAGSCTIAGNVTCSLGNVARGSSVTVLVTARASGASFAATARRSGGVPDQNAGDDAATVQVAGIGGTSGSGTTGTGTGSGPGGDTSAPVLTALSLLKTPKPSLRKGATVRFTLSEAASVQVTVERLLPGRLRAGACKAKGTGKRCTRPVKVTSFTRSLPAGAQSLKLTRKQLKVGRVRITLAATDAAGNRSQPAILQGTVRR